MSEIKKALDPNIKRASLSQVKKIRNTIKKTQMKNMPAKPKEEPKAAKTFDDLSDIVKIKKQKAVANEYDSLIHEQKLEKERREQGIKNKPPITSRIINPIEAVIANDPDKLKGMTLDEAKKLSMFTNKSGNNSNISDIKEVIIALNEIKKSDGGNGNLSDKVIGILLDKAFSNNGGKKIDSGNDKFMEYMMQQNLKTQELLLNILAEKKTAPVETQNPLIEKLFGIVKSQSEMENSFLKQRIEQLEMGQRQPQTDTYGEAKKLVDFVDTIKDAFGTTPKSEVVLEHEYKMKNLQFDQTRQTNDEIMRDRRIVQVGDMVNEGIKVIGKVLGEPIADAAKAKIEEFTESVKHPTEERPKRRISTEMLRQEIDLGNLEKLEDEIAEKAEKPRRNSRFRVVESGKG